MNQHVSANDLVPAASARKIQEMLSRNLRILAHRKGITQADLARSVGLHRTQIRRYMDGTSHPPPVYLYRICLFFKVDARILHQPLEELE